MLGAFRVVAPLGAGGMGEVYRAQDTRLGREVAVKVLPAEFAADPERLRRFEQEARAASALNHPNVLTVHEVGAHDGRPYLVTELLEGRSLRDVLRQGGKVERQTALEWAVSVARALAAAHAQGIVHRDLKPENLFVCTDGRIKILDFGLAKLVLPAGSSQSMLEEASTRTDLTGGQTILGTVGYMAPEQVRGEAVDGRADLFAFGCVLYEMLTGTRAFHGETPIDTLSAILHTRPPALEESSADLSPDISRLVTRCFAKNPAERWQCAGDLAAELERLAQERETDGAGAAVQRGSRGAGRLVAAAAVALLAGLGTGYLASGRRDGGTGTRQDQLTRFALEPPAGYTFSDFGASGGPAVSPDGGSIVFPAGDTSVTWLWLQRLDAVGATRLAGTKDASLPFWSPDGSQIGFLADGKLKRLVLATGAVHSICDAGYSLGATWTSRGTILFAPGPGQPIWKVPALGGTAVPVTKLADKEFIQGWPEALPGGERFLYDSITFDPESRESVWTVRMRAASVEGEGLPVDELVEPGRVRFVPPNWLLYPNGPALVGRRFDPDSLHFEGEPVVLAEPIVHASGNGHAPYSVGGDVLIYHEGFERTALIWYDRLGRRQQQVAEPGALWVFSLSPDETTVLLSRFNLESGAPEIWRADARRGGAVPLMHGAGWSWVPMFSPDGRRFVFQSTRRGPPDLFIGSLDPGTEPKPLHPIIGLKFPVDWAPDGKRILLQYQAPPAPYETWEIDASGDAEPVPLVTDLGETSGARIAPTGDLLAVSAKVSDQWQIYVQRYPEGDERTLVSSAGGVQPRWRGDGDELYFLGLDSYLYAVSIARRPRLDVGTPVRLFHLSLQGPIHNYQQYEPSRDGQRFLVNALVEGRGAPARVVLGWQSLLGRK